MPDLPPVPLAALAGFVCAMVFASIPVGPINLTILNEGSRRGFAWAMLIGLGASAMDGIYCVISFTSFTAFFDHGIVKALMQVFSVVFLIFLGCKYLFAQTVSVPTKLDAASEKLGARLDERLHPRSAFMTGFVRVLGNLGVLLTWIVLAATLIAHDWVADVFSAKAACVAGVLLGTNLWFLILSFGVSRGHGKFSAKTLLRLQHASGICLILAGVFDGCSVAWELTKHKF
jgi:threonine/homoserine/homoserine lactone efflux protein